MKWDKELSLAKQAARQAGDLLRQLSRDKIIDDSGRDIKHHADRESEMTILNLLKSASGYPLLAEESGEHGTPARGGDPAWIIDPLDGTVNFSQGIPFCCVSIALWQNDQPILGVVYDFNRKELFSGIVGEGAWRNDDAICVSAVSTPQKAILTTGFPVNRDFSSQSIQIFLSQIKHFKKIRLLGSAALSLAYVACGRVHAYTEEDIMLWDVAAGIAIVKAASGFVDFQTSRRKKWARNVSAGDVFRQSKRGH